MTVTNRAVHEADPENVAVRDPPELSDDDGLFRIRMPVTSTGEARDGDAFDRSLVEGFRKQLAAQRVPLFLDHGRGGPGETRYGQLRKVGYWAAPEIKERETTELDCDAVLVDPETLDDDVGEIKSALTWLRSQAEAGLPISASVGWSEDVGERDVPGGADLLEISIVGIPSDPRTTTTQSADETDPKRLAAELAKRGIRPFGPPDGDGDEFEDFDDCVETLLEDDDDLDLEDAQAICGSWQQSEKSERAPVPDDYSHSEMMAAKEQADEMGIDGGAIHAHGEGEAREYMPGATHVSLVAHLREQGIIEPAEANSNDSADRRAEYEVGSETLDLTPPEYMTAAAEAAAEAGEAGQIPGDCGTGVGDRRRDQIRDDEVGPDVVEEVASYLTSHEEDVSADGHPRSWTDDEWSDCGNAQYAKWGGGASDRAKDWAQRAANKVARARDEEEPYPNREMQTNNIDDPEFSEGDAVRWSSQDSPVHGRVAGVHEQFSPNSNVTITGEEGEAVYSIYEYDDSFSPPRFQNSPSEPNIAKPESSLSESGMDMPPATAENFEGDEENDMTDTDTDSLRMEMEEMLEEMVEMQNEQLDILREMRGTYGEEEEAAAADVDEQDADAEAANREKEPAEPKTQDRADDSADRDEQSRGFGIESLID
jgi:hypothetical protein